MGTSLRCPLFLEPEEQDADLPDNWQDEAEDRETLDDERADHEGVPTVDIEGPAGDGDAGSGA